MAAIQVNIRYPELLLKRIDAVAEGNRSEWILEACRMRLDGDTSVAEEAGGTSVAGSIPAPQSAKLDMQALRDICAGGVKTYDDRRILAASAGFPVEDHLFEMPICGKTWWEDGNHYECLMDKGHKEVKHGLRGMVRVID